MSDIPVICVDGPTASGKGTIAQQVARTLTFHLLDSGALYRLTALAALEAEADLDDEVAIAALARGLTPVFEPQVDGGTRIRLDGRDVTGELRAEEVGMAASRVAALPAVRQALLTLQRAFREPPGLVADGRDMGTVVFPDARLKIFLTASAAERAQRRYKQLKEKGVDANLPALLRDIEDRDARDRGRASAPLVPAEDAVVIDSTEQSIAEVTAEVVRLTRQRLDRE